MFIYFTFQTYIKRKIAKERAQRGEGVEPFGVRKSRNNREAAGQMELPHFQREERDYKPGGFSCAVAELFVSDELGFILCFSFKLGCIKWYFFLTSCRERLHISSLVLQPVVFDS